MSKHNYSQYSNKKNKGADSNSAVVEKTILIPADMIDDVAVVPEAAPEVEDVVVEAVNTPSTVKGVVSNCAKLNVRAYPSREADVVCVLDVTSEVEVYPEKSTYDWLCVCTVSGIEGYCMAKFVDVRQ